MDSKKSNNEKSFSFVLDEFSNRERNSRPHMPATYEYIPNRGIRRYSDALNHLIPFRRAKTKKKIVKVDQAGFFSLVTFSWLSEYIFKSYKTGLSLEDVPQCSPLDSCDRNAQRLELLWQDEIVKKGSKEASFGMAVWKFVRTRVFVSCVTFSLSCLMGFLSPTIFMRKLLEYLEEPNASQMEGIIWALALTTSEILRIMFFALYYSLSYRTATRLRAACLTLIYKKILGLNSARNTSVGEIVNLFAFDGPRLYYMIIFGPMAIGGPILSLCGFLYIFFVLGSWAVLGMIIFVSYYPLQYLLSHLTGYYRQKAVKESDKRIKIMTEILTNIKLIKMYAWDDWFSSQIQSTRKKELAEIEKIAYCQSIGISLAPTIPVISGIATFLIHVVTGGNLTAAQAFSVLVFLTKQMKTSIQVIRDGSLSFYEGLVSVQRFKAYTILVILHTQLRTALNNIRYGSENIVQGRIICNRIQNVLLMEENKTRISKQLDESLALSIVDGFFTWGVSFDDQQPEEKKQEEKEKLADTKPESTEVLHSINLSVPKGALIGVCGPVGAGKSSLLLACLGQLKMTSGQLSKAGTSAYVSQQSWVQNATLKENIIFGERFEPYKYISVLHASVLNEDVNFLPAGDETEIGERGINLSGGQKQRVSLARALYSNRDVYFLDDPFSAVDSQVGLQLFEKYVKEALAKKTVILVTNQIQFLQKCDEIIVMKEGRIVERGTYSELSSHGKEFGFMIQTCSNISSQKTVEELSGSDSLKNLKSSEEEKDVEYLKSAPAKNFSMKEEEKIHGTIGASAYHAYILAAGGYFVCFSVILIILLNVGSTVFSSWWLAAWIRAGSGNTTVIDPVTNETVISNNINDNPELPFYMTVYGSIICVIIATCVVRGFFYTKVTIRASRVLHRKLFEKVVRSPCRYFEVTPIGRIQNLFSRDIDEVDSRLPDTVETMLQNLWMVLFSFLSIALVFYWIVIPLVFLACLYYFISKIFRAAVRDLKRMENISRAPVFSWISATVHGLPTIHAFNKERDYIHQFCKLFDENSTVLYLSSNAMRWMAVRLDSISVLISGITSFLVVFLKGTVAPAYAGLALSYAAQICGVFQYTIRLMSENEARFISVERIQQNIDKLVSEGNSEPEEKVPPDWPSKGAIRFHQVRLSYGHDLPEVLNGISFSIQGGEKIGVVGRTGAGKSSLTVALFRLVELASGSILIDDINIARVPLSVLRSRLSIIPQDPTLFSDTLRANLDPFNTYEDDKLWEVLQKTKLAEKVKLMPNKMLTYVGEGENLSVGEKQLLCLARTLLRGSKILILDEATASVDPETETAVQTTIEAEFKDCTVITIAHRLSTVTNCDRILVIDQGVVLEFDNPKVLMDDKNSHFSKMLAAAEA